jgi:CPA1 family monovalent cation:H+ antiporter
MQEAAVSVEVALASVLVVILVLLSACLIALAPLRRIRLPFTVAIMLFGSLVGIAVETLERHGFGFSTEPVLQNVVEAPQSGITDDSQDEPSSSGPSVESSTDDHESGHPFLLRRLIDEFVSVFRAASDGLTPTLILFVFIPILVFESAYNMEARQVIRNFLPITVLALPGVQLSTVMCGAVMMMAGGQGLGITWEVALLFGVIVSATDPVAVVGLFKELGAPKRLGILVEGESLFNDGTAIVLFNILLAFVIGTAATGGGASAAFLSGGLEFLKVVGGGAVVGLLLAWAGWRVIGSIIENLPIKISLTIVMAYASFVIAEHLFHVSGVIAVVLAGLVSGSYGQLKLSQSMSEFMREFWEFLSFVMNSLIFFLVGLVIALKLDFRSFAAVLPLLGAVIIGLIIARAISIFGTMPMLRRLMEAVDSRYQAVMFWGGLRGAVGLALALTVVATPGIPGEIQQVVLTLTAGVVLFTLLVNALTMEPLLVMLGLNRPSIVDRFAIQHAELVVCDAVSEVLDRMEREELFAPDAISEFRGLYVEREQTACDRLADLREETSKTPGSKEAVAGLLALAVEKREVFARFSDGSISEDAARTLLGSSDRLLDIVKSGEKLPEIRPLDDSAQNMRARLLAFLESRAIMNWLIERLRSRQLAEQVDLEHGLYIAALGVDRNLQGMEDARTIDLATLGRIQARFFSWELKAQQKIERLAEAFPPAVRAVQKTLMEHEVLRAEARALHRLWEVGLLTETAWMVSHEETIRRERILQRKLRTGA